MTFIEELGYEIDHIPQISLTSVRSKISRKTTQKVKISQH